MEVEIWSDIACPWCYIGKRHLEAAMAQFEHADEVRLTWRSFELDPAAPAQIPGDAPTLLAHKYGVSVEQARQMQQRVTDAAAGDGLDYHLEQTRLGSTFDAHRIIHLAREHGLQDAMKERLLRARLSEGRLISDPETLVELAVAVGLPEDEVRDTLAGDRFAAAVREDEETARRFGITGVPMFVVDRELGASGAQPPELLLSLLRQGWENRALV
ncbi:MAG TPA: DsbA family oxidoreductase [Solirubrobacteraceae bacterium]